MSFVEFDFVDLEREFLNWSADGEELDALNVGAGPGDSLAVRHLLQVSERDPVLFPFTGRRGEGDVVKHVVSNAGGGEIDSEGVAVALCPELDAGKRSSVVKRFLAFKACGSSGKHDVRIRADDDAAFNLK